MDFNSIPLSAAGSLSVSVVALFLFAFQSFFFIKRRKLNYNAWAAIFSFSTAGYAFFVFLEYLTYSAEIQFLIGKIQFSFLIIMIHSLVGFSLSYLQVPSELYHKIASPINLLLFIILWSTDWIKSSTIVVKILQWVERPFLASGLGPLGAPFMAYLIASSLFSLFLWMTWKTREPHLSKRFGIGIGLAIYIFLGIHDALASTGVIPAVQFLLDYGFLAFSTSMLYVTVHEHIQIENQAYVLQRLNEELGIIARTDSLTKLANRYSFDRQYEKEWKILKRQRRQKTTEGSLSLILCDIDFFKEYNDTYGHMAGDACLVAVAEILATCARRPADLVSRYGGDEFAILLPETLQPSAVILAELMLHKMHERNLENKSSPVQPHVTISLGVASVSADTEFAQEDLFLRADRALYKAKKNGRNRVEECTESLATNQ